ncbi:MAG: spermidine synthase [Longimicrobiales bacterium]
MNSKDVTAKPGTLRRIAAVLFGLGLAAAVAVTVFAVVRAPVIYQTDSAFGHIFVTENRRGVRSLYFGEGKARQGAAVPGRPTHLEVAYMRVATVGLALPAKVDRVLFVGLGVGAMPMYTRAKWPEAHIDVVEIDPVVVDVAEHYFGFARDGRMEVHVEDGRTFIESGAGPSYDLIVLDAYSDEGVPRHLTTHEFLSAVRARLAPNGIVVSNLWGSSSVYGSMLATFEEAFGDLAVVRAGGVQRIVVVSNGGGPLDEEGMVEAASKLARRFSLGFDLPRLIRAGYVQAPRSIGPVLVDGGNG